MRCTWPSAKDVIDWQWQAEKQPQTPRTPKSLWERACSRRLRRIQHIRKLTHRFREQARSHKVLRPITNQHPPKTTVGASLLTIAAWQSTSPSTVSPLREQARSHKLWLSVAVEISFPPVPGARGWMRTCSPSPTAPVACNVPGTGTCSHNFCTRPGAAPFAGLCSGSSPPACR